MTKPNKKVAAVGAALDKLKAALKEVGVDHLTVRLLDHEDAYKIAALFDDKPRPMFSPFRDTAFHMTAEIGEISVVWRNIQRSQMKNTKWREQQERKRRQEELEREADRVAQNARRAYLAEHGGLQ